MPLQKSARMECMPSKTRQIGVVCTSCSWSGRRNEVGDAPCPVCGGLVVARKRRSPNAETAPRVRVVVHVQRDTVDALEDERERTGVVGIGTVGSRVLDDWATHRKR